MNDQIISSTDRRGAVTTYTRDVELNLTLVTLPNGGVVTHTWDNENRLTSTTDPEGNTTTRGLTSPGRWVWAGCRRWELRSEIGSILHYCHAISAVFVLPRS